MVVPAVGNRLGRCLERFYPGPLENQGVAKYKHPRGLMDPLPFSQKSFVMSLYGDYLGADP